MKKSHEIRAEMKVAQNDGREWRKIEAAYIATNDFEFSLGEIASLLERAASEIRQAGNKDNAAPTDIARLVGRILTAANDTTGLLLSEVEDLAAEIDALLA